jgi:hypothetical protein
MTVDNVLQIIALLGIGGILANSLRIRWELKNSKLLQKQEFKETRYKCIIILMLSLLDFDKNKQMLHMHGRQYIKSKEDLEYELQLEWNNMILYASKEVLQVMHSFIQNPSQDLFNKTALAMRKDLWGGKLSLEALYDSKLK